MYIKPWHCAYCMRIFQRMWVRRLLVVGIAQLRSGFSSRPVRVVFLVDRMAMGQVFLRLLLSNFPANTVSPMLHFLIRHRHHITLVIDGIVKLHAFHSTSHFFTSYIYFCWIRLCMMTLRVRREVSLRSNICTAQSVSAHVSADKRQRTRAK
jgi:hypothetical protein